MNTEKTTNLFLECKDHTVSGESFELRMDKEYDMLITFPKPNENELSKYYDSDDYISHTDSKRTVFEKMYHLVKSYSLNKKVKLISKLNKGEGQLLDIGAGTGDFLAVAQKKGWNVTGVEPNEYAKKLAEQKGVLLEQETQKLKSKTFDIITMWHVLEHVPDLQDQIKELRRLLKPGGYIIIAVPNFKSYDASYYKSFWAAYDVPRHLWHFSKESIHKLFANQNLNLQKILPMKFDSYYVSLLSEKYKNGKMNFFKAFLIGCYSNLKGRTTNEFSSHIYIIKN